MKAKLLGQYRSSKTGNLVYRYELNGTQAEISAYQAIQGENFKLDDKSGKPLFFSTRYHGAVCTINFNRENTKVFVDTTEIDALQNLAAQYAGTPTGDHLAAEIAKKMVADVQAGMKVMSSNSVTSITSTTEVEEKQEDLNSL